MKPRPYQLEAIDKATEAWKSHRHILGVAATGLGKAQPLSAQVLTPWGFAPMGSLRVGSVVCTPDGKAARVDGIFPQGVRSIYEIEFSDGGKTRCTLDHLWAVQTKSDKARGRGFREKTTGELLFDLVDGSGAAKWFIPVTRPVFFGHTSPDIDPYAMGILIGDGGLRHGAIFTTADARIVEEMRARMSRWGEVVHRRGYDYQIKGRYPTGRGGLALLSMLASMNLDCYSHEKFIPPVYLFAGVNDRLALLRGLMDSDGTAAKDGHAEFNTTSEQLARDVVFLVRSLGGVTRTRVRPFTTYTHKGQKKTGLPSYRVTVTLNGINPFMLSRKADRVPLHKKQGQTRAIKSITGMGAEACQCIHLDHPDHLYITDDFIVTHNTVIFAHLAQREAKRVMILAHREELIFQAADKVASVTGTRPDIEMADQKADVAGLHGRSQVVVSSIQTQVSGMGGHGRMTRFTPDDFSLVIVDEAHHATASTYRRVLAHYARNEKLRTLGVTATPDRADEAALGQVFQHVAFEFDVRYGITQGWLVPVEQTCVHVHGLDLSSVRTTAGDLNGADLARVLEAETAVHEIAAPTIDIARDRKTLVFCASLAHAEKMAEVLNRHRSGCARWVSGATPKDERRGLFADYAARRFQFLINVGVATEGFDDPGIECVVMARPTKSRSLYAQMIGRGTRALPGVVDTAGDTAEARRQAIGASLKPSVEIVDFSGNAGRHKLISTADILGGTYSDEIVEAVKERAQQAGGRPVDTMQALEEAEAEAKALREKQQREREAQAEAARRANLKPVAKYVRSSIDPFNVLDIEPARERGWDTGKQITPKMLKVLKAAGIEPRDLTYGQAGQLVAEITARWRNGQASFKQAAILKRFGCPTNVTFAEASKTIDAIKAAGWKRPPALSGGAPGSTPAPSLPPIPTSGGNPFTPRAVATAAPGDFERF